LVTQQSVRRRRPPSREAARRPGERINHSTTASPPNFANT
jgi:hypothetical protein